MTTQEQIDALAPAERRVLFAAETLEALGCRVTQERLAEALGATGGDRRPIGSAVAALKRRGALRVVDKVRGSQGRKVEALIVTGVIREDPGAPPGRVSREAVVNYLATCSDSDLDSILTEAARRAPQ